MNFPVKSVADLEKLSYAVKWQYFERLVGYIFEQNGFEVRHNVIIKDETLKRQIDLIAEKYGTTYLVECKKWRNKTRAAAIKSAARKHLDRCIFYTTLHGDCLPIIVTLIDDSVEYENMPIVPIMKLNSFLNSDLPTF